MPRIIIDVYTKMSKYAVTLYTGIHVTIKNRPLAQIYITGKPSEYQFKVNVDKELE